MIYQFYNEFSELIEKFHEEPRAFVYDLACRLIQEAKDLCQQDWYTHDKTIQAILLLLFCWNFAARATKKLTFLKVKELLERNKNTLKELEKYSLVTTDNLAYEKIQRVFDDFRLLFGQTGSSKALSLMNPKLFVMWDTKIRNKLKKFIEEDIANGQTGECYINYLSGIKKIIKRCDLEKRDDSNAPLAKRLDEYHFAKIIMMSNNKS